MKLANPKILIFSSEFPPLPGGIGNHALNLSNQLNKNGYSVEVIADQRSKSSEEFNFDKDLGFKVNRVRLQKIRLFMYFQRLLMLGRAIKKAQVVIATGKFPLWAVAIASFFYKRSYIAIIHGSEVNFKPVLLKKSIDLALGRFTKVVAVSRYTAGLVSSLNLDISVIPNGFDSSDWLINDKNGTRLDGDPRLITVGNVTERKGQLNVITHLPEIINKFPDLHYHCIGLPTRADDFILKAKEIGVHRHVSFHGRVKHDDLKKYLLGADIFVMLSNTTREGDVEGFGIAILEANSLGIPAIGSMGCGIEDAISDKNSGLLIDPMSATEFSAAISQIMNDHKSFSDRSKQWAEHHQWDKVIKSYIQLIDES